MKKTIYVPDIECDSCSKLISKKLSEEQGINNFSMTEESVDVDFDEQKTNTQNIIKIISDSGFRASEEPFERKTLKERMRDFKENKKKYEVEKKILRYTVALFFALLIIEAIVYFVVLKNIPDFIQKYALWIIYLDVSVSVIALGMWHIFSYRAKVTCMVGMMIGMTIGMQTGMMIGAILGATNGFFTGAMVGMLLAVIVGSIAGKCCGVMGVMEGMMAGVMGGTMGPMISVMMFSDNLNIFMPVYLIINIIITWGLSYMLYEEVVENKKGVIKKPIDFMTLTAYTTIITLIILAIMLYGPKSGLASF